VIIVGSGGSGVPEFSRFENPRTLELRNLGTASAFQIPIA